MCCLSRTYDVISRIKRPSREEGGLHSTKGDTLNGKWNCAVYKQVRKEMNFASWDFVYHRRRSKLQTEMDSKNEALQLHNFSPKSLDFERAPNGGFGERRAINKRNSIFPRKVAN